jgi:hypothetical protein
LLEVEKTLTSRLQMPPFGIEDQWSAMDHFGIARRHHNRSFPSPPSLNSRSLHTASSPPAATAGQRRRQQRVQESPLPETTCLICEAAGGGRRRPSECREEEEHHQQALDLANEIHRISPGITPNSGTRPANTT